MSEKQGLWYRGVYEDARIQLVGKVKEAFYKLLYQDKAIEIAGNNHGLSGNLLYVAGLETRKEYGRDKQELYNKNIVTATNRFSR